MEGRCHCGAVRIAVPSPPSWVGSCNCSLCKKVGGLWAYYPDAEVRIDGATTPYIWGDKMIGIHHCTVCGCTTHWQTLGEDFGKMGVNARMLADFDPHSVELRLLDNADP